MRAHSLNISGCDYAHHDYTKLQPRCSVQSTQVVSHHFSSFVLSRRAVRPHVHGTVARAHTHGHVLSCRAARRTFDTRWLSRQTVSNAIAIYLGGATRGSVALLHYNVQHCTAVSCKQGCCKAMQCSVNHLFGGRRSLAAAAALLGLSVPEQHQG